MTQDDESTENELAPIELKPAPEPIALHPVPMKRGRVPGHLSDRQKAFCEAFVACGNGGQAALHAGFSKKGAPQTASALMKYPHIKAYIAQLREGAAEKAELTTQFVLKHLMQVAMQPDLKSSAKVTALQLLGKHLSMFIDRSEIKVGPMTLEERAERVQQLLMKGASK